MRILRVPVLCAALGGLLGFSSGQAVHAQICAEVRCWVYCHNAAGQQVGNKVCEAGGDSCECFTSWEGNGYAYCHAFCEIDSELTFCSSVP